MSVSQLTLVPVSATAITPQLQISRSVKKYSRRIDAYDHSSVDLIKESDRKGMFKLPSLLNIFPIQFIYWRKLIRTKVMKANYGYSNPFYKVVLTTLMHNSASFWWLQFQSTGWVVLLGPRIGENLKRAIISAIEGHESLVSIQHTTES